MGHKTGWWKVRDYVTVDELLGLMNERLQEAGDYADCQFSGPLHRYADPDETGCNWSDDLIFRCSGRSAAPRPEEIGPILVWARERYNLLSRDGTIEDLVFEANGHQFECRARSEAVVSTADVGPPADGDNTGWWVRIDDGAWRRAFDASLDDQDAREIRSRVVHWHDSLGNT